VIQAPPHPQPPSFGDPIHRTPSYSPSLLQRRAPPHPVRCALTPPVPERLDDRAGSANPKICVRLCSRWHCRHVLPQGAEQIESGADRGWCSFSPLDPRRRSSFSSTSCYPNDALRRSRSRCPDKICACVLFFGVHLVFTIAIVNSESCDGE
jgi:hypothetical protein